jgi:alcohol dehydrogenase class IV
MIESGSSVLLVTGERSWEAVSKIRLYSGFFDKYYPTRVSIGTVVPELDNLIEIVKRFRDDKPDAIVAIGGGKIIDSAKVIAGLISCKSGDPVSNISKGVVGDYVPKIVAMPTTAGSGSEATSFAVVYHKGKKMSYNNEKLVPEEVIFSVDAVKMQPRNVLVSSALDATCQAIESIWAISATESSKKMAFESLRTIWRHMKGGLSEDCEAEDLIRAANLSGRAINISKTTGPHALSYGLTMVLDVPHGIAVSLLMSGFLKRHQDLPVMEEICKVIGFPASEAWIEMLQSVKPSLEIVTEEINHDTVEELVSWVNEERMSNNPIPIRKQEICDSFFNIIETVDLIRGSRAIEE